MATSSGKIAPLFIAISISIPNLLQRFLHSTTNWRADILLFGFASECRSKPATAAVTNKPTDRPTKQLEYVNLFAGSTKMTGKRVEGTQVG